MPWRWRRCRSATTVYGAEAFGDGGWRIGWRNRPFGAVDVVLGCPYQGGIGRHGMSASDTSMAPGGRPARGRWRKATRVRYRGSIRRQGLLRVVTGTRPTDGLYEKGTTMTVTDANAAPSFADLGRDLLEKADLEVVTSFVTLPPSFQLPPHRHPGEEFAYVVEGGIHYWQQGTDGERHMTAGSFAKVPLNAVHSIRTDDDQGAKLVVFRVHTPGAPERELVDIDA